MDRRSGSDLSDGYAHGHHESVLRSQRWRTAANSAAYLLPHLRQGMSLLDVGCGTGTITRDLAAVVSPGRVVGIDSEADVVATAVAATTDANPTFEVGDAMSLAFADETFDVVHAHQVLQHLRDPVGALREMSRVGRPGGIVAVRESDYGRFHWWPPDPRLDEWNRVYHRITAVNSVEADAGRHVEAWCHEAGLTDLAVSSSEWRFETDHDRRWWGDTWAERVLHSSFARHARDHTLADEPTLESFASAFREWAGRDGAGFVVAHVEVLARVPAPRG